MQVSDWIQLLIGLVNIGVLIFVALQFGLLRRQNWADIFSRYTKRYADIIREFPEDINEDSFDLEELKSKQASDDTYKKTMRAMRNYFDL